MGVPPVGFRPALPPSLELSSSVQLCLPRLHWHGFPHRPGSAVHYI